MTETPLGWHFLVGKPPQIAALTKQMGFNYKWNEEQKQNISKLNKGKLIGKNNPAVIITEDIAKDIKVRLSKGEKTKSIVEYLGVTNDVVNNIKMLRTWKDLLPELNALIIVVVVVGNVILI